MRAIKVEVYPLSHCSSQVPSSTVSAHCHSLWIDRVLRQHFRLQEVLNGLHTLFILHWEVHSRSHAITAQNKLSVWLIKTLDDLSLPMNASIYSLHRHNHCVQISCHLSAETVIWPQLWWQISSHMKTQLTHNPMNVQNRTEGFLLPDLSWKVYNGLIR